LGNMSEKNKTVTEAGKEADIFGILPALSEVHRSWMERPREFERMRMDLIVRLEEAALEEIARFLPADSSPQDQDEGAVSFLDMLKTGAQLARKYHAIHQKWLKELIEQAQGMEERERQRALFWVRQAIGACSPANFFWTNPGALQRFMDSSGESLMRGFQRFHEDLQLGNFLLRLTDDTVWKIGENIAATPGRVVFRNELMELIQYEPATRKTQTVPIVFIQPWINKFYIFDLNPSMSFVGYLRDRGFTVFIISWKNPISMMRHVTFEDYMMRGALKAIDAARAICRSGTVHAAGYCIGGTVLAALMAWFNEERSKKKKSVPVTDWTLFSTLVDSSEPGDLGFFITEKSVVAIEDIMEENGYLSEKYIEMVFRMLGSDSLIWRNFVQTCLFGMAPPKSDILFWNSDSTRLPEAMCVFYLRELYLNNRLAEKDRLVLGGRPIDLGCIEQPLYVVGTQLDHICPWKSTFKTCSLVGGPVRYVLSSEGHITGIVNPPSETSRRRYWVGDAAGERDPEDWLRRREESRGSWWEDWVTWLSGRGKGERRPPSMGSRKFPPLEKAPGSYVMER